MCFQKYKMPWKSKVDSELMVEVLKMFDIFYKNNCLKSRSDKVWENVCKLLLPSKIQTANLNAYFKYNC